MFEKYREIIILAVVTLGVCAVLGIKPHVGFSLGNVFHHRGR